MKQQLDILSIAVDECGRPVLSDDELLRLERIGHGTFAGRGTNSGDCTGTTNGGCYNISSCGNTSNGFCMNQGVCPKYQEQ